MNRRIPTHRNRVMTRELLLAELQRREITPEDYELLLTLDESVAPKYCELSPSLLYPSSISPINASSSDIRTVPAAALESLPQIPHCDARQESCSVCMHDFEVIVSFDDLMNHDWMEC